MGFFSALVKALLTAALILALVDVGVRRFFPAPARLDDNFSAAYLRRELQPAQLDGRIVVLGDSVLWGYGLAPSEAAVTRLRDDGVPIVNLSYQGGSPPNTYALVKLLQARGIRPRAVLFNINLKEFNAADSAFQTLYPGVEQLAWPLLSDGERAQLRRTQTDTTDARVDRFLGTVWSFYGMRADVREQLFGAVDAATALMNLQHGLSGETEREAIAHRPTPDRFEGTYDLSPLDDSNVGVIFLRKALALLRSEKVPAYAVLTPTNHLLLHDYIDVPEYRANLTFLGRLATAAGARVLDYDRAFPPGEFLDNDHLTVAGNLALAARLRRDLHLSARQVDP